MNYSGAAESVSSALIINIKKYQQKRESKKSSPFMLVVIVRNDYFNAA